MKQKAPTLGTTHPAEELLPAGHDVFVMRRVANWRKENDILDVWFDSGSSNLAVLDASERIAWPADIYLEGAPTSIAAGSRVRCWWASACADVRRSGQCVTHGWTLDEQGRPMSKSLGNVMLPSEICEKWGADLLRLWVASQEYQADVNMCERVMTQLSEAYRKIRNTFRFALGNLSGFDPSRDALAHARDGRDRPLDAGAHRGFGAQVPRMVCGV